MSRRAKRTILDSRYNCVQAGISCLPSKIDAHIGRRIRDRRRVLGKTQAELGHALGLSPQQVQKYERGENRMSASKLYVTAQVLGVTPFWFYLDL